MAVDVRLLREVRWNAVASMSFVRALAPGIAAVAALYALTILLRGNENPGGGLAAGLALAAALVVLGAACGAARLSAAVRLAPHAIAAIGALIAVAAGVFAWLAGFPYLSGIVFRFRLLGSEVTLSTVLALEIGVALATAGALLGVALALLERDA